MKAPTACIFWREPERIASGSLRDDFEVLEEFFDTSELLRCLIRCRECGQLYFFEFYEFTDWEEGRDSQYCTYIPVESDEEVEELKKATVFKLLTFYPRLQCDSPKGAERQRVRWILEENGRITSRP